MSRQAVSKWERDETLPEVEKVLRISRYFQVSADYLLKDEMETPDGTAREPENPKMRWHLLGWVTLVLGAVGLLRMLPGLVLLLGAAEEMNVFPVRTLLVSGPYLLLPLILIGAGMWVLLRGRTK